MCAQVPRSAASWDLEMALDAFECPPHQPSPSRSTNASPVPHIATSNNEAASDSESSVSDDSDEKSSSDDDDSDDEDDSRSDASNAARPKNILPSEGPALVSVPAPLSDRQWSTIWSAPPTTAHVQRLRIDPESHGPFTDCCTENERRAVVALLIVRCLEIVLRRWRTLQKPRLPHVCLNFELWCAPMLGKFRVWAF